MYEGDTSTHAQRNKQSACFLQVVLFSEPTAPIAAAGALLIVVTNAAVATAKLTEAEEAVKECHKAEMV